MGINMSPATEKSTKAKGAKAATKKPEASHPPTAVMIKAAIETLKERKGSSLIAIKKYCATNYKIDPVKMSSFFKKALASGVEKKTRKSLRRQNRSLLRKSRLHQRRKQRQRASLLHRRKPRPRRRRWRSQKPRRKLQSPRSQ